eukprot:scaffold2191_cov254-Pinguiococcus_pyrenoidosus.AAC.13
MPTEVARFTALGIIRWTASLMHHPEGFPSHHASSTSKDQVRLPGSAQQEISHAFLKAEALQQEWFVAQAPRSPDSSPESADDAADCTAAVWETINNFLPWQSKLRSSATASGFHFSHVKKASAGDDSSSKEKEDCEPPAS